MYFRFLNFINNSSEDCWPTVGVLRTFLVLFSFSSSF